MKRGIRQLVFDKVLIFQAKYNLRETISIQREWEIQIDYLQRIKVK